MSALDSKETDRLAEAKRRVTSEEKPAPEKETLPHMLEPRVLRWSAGGAIATLLLLSLTMWIIPSGPPEPSRLAVTAPAGDDIWALEPPARVEDTPPTARLATLTIEPALFEPAAPALPATDPVPSFTPEPRVAPDRAASPAPAVTQMRSPLVAIVIDDIGLDHDAAARAIALPPPVTLAILPYASGTVELDAMARAAGHETLVHMPMEPKGLDDPGMNALYTWLTDEELSARVRSALATTPGAIGFNNHMGSRFTACARCVDAVAREAEAAGMVVLDSLTTPDSLLAEAARAAGAVSLSRDVFLDNQRDSAAIAVRLEEAERIAWSRGWAVAIGHPAEETLAALEEWIPQARARGVMVGGITDALERLEPINVADRSR